MSFLSASGGFGVKIRKIMEFLQNYMHYNSENKLRN